MTYSPFLNLMKINPVFCNAPFPLPERNLGGLADLTSNLLITCYWLKVDSLICVFKKPPGCSCGQTSPCITNMMRIWCVCVCVCECGAVICIRWLCIWQLDWRTPLVSSDADGSCAVWQLGSSGETQRWRCVRFFFLEFVLVDFMGESCVHMQGLLQTCNNPTIPPSHIFSPDSPGKSPSSLMY